MVDFLTTTMEKQTSVSVMGRASIFRDKKGGSRVQGVMTPIGSRAFEQARQRLGKLASVEKEKVSDADTIEYLARGETATKKYLGV